MDSDTDNNGGEGGAKAVLDAVHRETSSASEQASAAAGAVKDQARQAVSTITGKAAETAETGKDFAASNLEDFAAAIRKASEELGSRDQSMISNLVRQAASGLEDASRSVKGASLQDITQSVAGFARRQPAAFLLGAGLVGIALGRFARASGEHQPQGGGSRPGEGNPGSYRPDGGTTGTTAEPGVDPSFSGSGARTAWTTDEAASTFGSDFSGDARPLTGDDHVR